MTPFEDICAMMEYESESEIFIGVFRFHALFFITQSASVMMSGPQLTCQMISSSRGLL